MSNTASTETNQELSSVSTDSEEQITSENSLTDSVSDQGIESQSPSSEQASEPADDGSESKIEADSSDNAAAKATGDSDDSTVASDNNSDNESAKEENVLDVDKTLEQIKSLLKDLASALENGQLKQSISLFEQCQFRIKKLEQVKFDSAKLKKIEKKLGKTQFEIQQLKKWRNWSMNQAREELVENLVALKDSEDHPRELHTKLKVIRDQWNKWNKSGDFPNQKIREKYQEAYNEAFKPCKKFFKEQKKERKQNKKTRKRICAELEALFEATDWGHRPDWKTIGNAIRQARTEWKKAVPLNKKDWDSTNAKFDRVMDQFQPYLEREREKGIQFREELIRKANALDNESLKVAIEKAKSLQSEWNSVTLRARKNKENQLWKEFKSACDRQFQRRNDIRKERDRQWRDTQSQRQTLVDEIKAINQTPVAQIKDCAAQVKVIQQKWRQAEDPRKGKKSAVEVEFNAEISKFKQLIKQAARLETEGLFTVLEQKADICDALELQGSADDVDAVIAEFQNKWDNVTESCGEYETTIHARFRAACQKLQEGTSPEKEVAENYEIKQQICLQLEVLADLDSPPEYARQRMQFNVERLSAVMAKQSGTTDSESEINELLVKFWLTGAVPQQHCQTINERFQRIRSALPKA